MIDILPFLAQKIEPICQTAEQFPDTEAAFPLATLCEIGNSADTVLDGKERLSLIEVQIDVWDNGKTSAKCKQLAAEISEVITAVGLRRYFGNTVPDPAVPQRYTMRFHGRIDQQTGMVYVNQTIHSTN